MSDYHKNYYLEHRQEIRARRKKLYHDNPGPTRKKQREYYQKNRTIILQKQREYWRTNPDKYHHSRLLHDYGISLQEFYTMLQTQENKCACCGDRIVPFKENGPNFANVDHDHTFDRPDGSCPKEAVRALLCHPCNNMIGCAKEKQSRLEAGIRYLARWSVE